MRTKKVSALATAMALVLASAGCATTFPMTADPAVLFAKGEVEATFEENGNGKMTVRVDHLGDPAKLAPTATVYVVWLQPAEEGAAIQNVGALKVDDDYSGKHTFSTAFKSFKITVTPEPSADVTKPSGREVLSAAISD